ncbi:S8 family peptidase [Halalkalibacter krulwichiae]|uniref:Intracellular serine protease n=1 Tax=Halalkalibacter krulwichiae TaxID=199441 RepID=A0A1X9MCU7_9BACI|nr:S8 family peptidase [Halalkalibacter krulwichiae]ARK31238.1 Intracellular serine protease [Halalkalibacter krulwichiae]
MSKVGLIPYKIETVVKETKVVPPGIELIQAPSLWNQGITGEGVVIAVLDTGCDTSHFELKDQIISGYNFTTDDDSNPNIFEDYNGHGTHVCGTIAAAENGKGVIGVAPKVRLLVLKVLGGQGFGDTSWVTEGVQFAMNWRGENGERVRVISMSLGGKEKDLALHQAVQAAVKKDILVVCAAGNEGDGDDQTDEYAYPGAFPEVVQVGSVNNNREISKFSNTNCKIDLVAPGEDVLSTYLNGEFAVLSGTSMAAPHVSGAAALLIEKGEKEFERRLTEPEVYAQLIKRTVSLHYSRRFQGNGLIHLAKERFVEMEQSEARAAN